MKKENYEETIRLFNSKRLFSGAFPDLLPDGAEITDSLEDAMILANEQELPDGYSIWEDIQENAVASFRTTAEFHEAMTLIEPIAKDVWLKTKAARLELRKKEIRETSSEYEEFISTLSGDVLEQLKNIAAGQICENGKLNKVLDSMRLSYFAGYYPCGWSKSGHIVVYDPRALRGFQENILST